MNGLLKITCCVIAIFLVITPSANADSFGVDPSRCKKPQWQCSLVFVSEKTDIHARPDNESPIVGSWYRLQPGLGNPEDMNKGNEWVEVYPFIENEGSPKTAWAKAKDIIFATRFKKVLGCWPVKELYFDLGDAPPSIVKFEKSGHFVDSNGDGVRRGWTYLYGNLVILRFDSSTKGGGLIWPSELLREDGALKVDGADKQENFSDSELSGCNAEISLSR